MEVRNLKLQDSNHWTSHQFALTLHGHVFPCWNGVPVTYHTCNMWCRASGGTGMLPHVVQNLMTRHSAAALEHLGHCTEAAALRTAARLCRRAAAAVAAGSGAAEWQATLAAQASVARDRFDFWRAARKPWKVRRCAHRSWLCLCRFLL